MATVIPEPNLVDGQSLEVEAQLTPEVGMPTAVMFLPGPDGMSRESWIDKTEIKGTLNLDISIKAKSVSGSSLEMDLASIPIQGAQPAIEPEPPKEEPKPEPKPEPVAEAEPEPEAKPESEPEVAEEEDSGWVNVIIFILINLLVIGGGAGAYWYFRKRSGSILTELSEEDEIDELDTENGEVEAVEPQEEEPEKEEAEEEEAEEEEAEEEEAEEEPQEPEKEEVAEEEAEEEEEKISPDKDMDDLSDLDPKEDEAK
jgi:flagellar basal body-associated protein FliL